MPANAMLDHSGSELREAHRRSRSEETRRRTLAELERRRDNLRDAVIPAWERALRGEKPDDWEVV